MTKYQTGWETRRKKEKEKTRDIKLNVLLDIIKQYKGKKIPKSMVVIMIFLKEKYINE